MGEEVLKGLRGLYDKFRYADIQNAVSLCLMWTVWRERNRKAFEVAERPMTD